MVCQVIIEKEMDDFINIKKELFDKWLDMAKATGYKLLDYLFSQNVPPLDYFKYIANAIHQETPAETPADVSFTTQQLV
jgi:hypothetical protein